jgi:hypothetical protein
VSANAQFIGFALAVAVPCLTLLLNVLISSGRTADLRTHMDAHFDAFDARFDAQDRSLAEKLQRFEERIDARLARTERLLNLS